MREKLLQEYVDKIKSIDVYDVEMAHGDADDFLCEILKKLGYGKLVEEYDKIPKWYA